MLKNDNDRLPNFIIGGGARCGTSYLTHVLDKHPEIYMAKPYVPEPKICVVDCKEGIEGYRRQYSQLFQDAPKGAILGEKTTAYLENKVALERLKQVLNEDALFIFMVREPVARMYSNYLHTKKNGLEKLSFEEAIELDGKRKDPFLPERSYVRPFDYIFRSDYATFAEQCYNIFSQKRIKFMLFEHIPTDSFYHEVQTFLQVDPLPRAKLEGVPINASSVGQPKLDSQIERKLRVYMRPIVERFANLTGLDVGVWGY